MDNMKSNTFAKPSVSAGELKPNDLMCIHNMLIQKLVTQTSKEAKSLMIEHIPGLQLSAFEEVRKEALHSDEIGPTGLKKFGTKINNSEMSSAALMCFLHIQKIKQIKSDRQRPDHAKRDVKKVDHGTLPDGDFEEKPVRELFKLGEDVPSWFNLSLPSWKWKGEHPHVPSVDRDYLFRFDPLLKVCYALLKNNPAYLFGHTGSGKTTLVEQVAARLKWPFMRVNFDSEITRFDLMGRDVISQEGGASVSSFAEGVLPQMMSGPYIGCLDEIDFARPDVAYVLQRAVEGNGLLVTEDGGRVINPHPMFRLFATGNTKGQGDEHSAYQGARHQSLAFLDRFKVWVDVDYMDEDQREWLLDRKVPELDNTSKKMLVKYVENHQRAFVNNQIQQPMSPRTLLSLAEATIDFTQGPFQGLRRDEAHKLAFDMCVLDRCTSEDRAVLKEIVNAVVK